jgi:hypothetical protein
METLDLKQLFICLREASPLLLAVITLTDRQYTEYSAFSGVVIL